MTNSKAEIPWKEYEELIYKIYQELEPHADVKLNHFIQGIESGTSRQIDISIRKLIATHEILIVIQAKNLKRKADVNIIGEFDAILRDVRASKGILICNSDFTNKAKVYAKNKKIDLCSVHDASSKNWQTLIQVPVIKRSVKVRVKINHQSVLLEEASLDGISMPHPVNAYMEFLEAWQTDKLDKTPGEHALELGKDAITLPVKSIPLKSVLVYNIEHRHHFKFFVPTDYRGIKDFFTQHFTPTFIEFNEVLPFLNDGTWQYLPDPTEISINSTYLQIEMIDFDFLKKKFIRSTWEKK